MSTKSSIYYSPEENPAVAGIHLFREMLDDQIHLEIDFGQGLIDLILTKELIQAIKTIPD